MNDDKIKPLLCCVCGKGSNISTFRGVPVCHDCYTGKPSQAVTEAVDKEHKALGFRPIAQEVREEEKKKWCAMCGKWGNHQSGTCPDIVREAQPEFVQEYLLGQKLIEELQSKLSALTKDVEGMEHEVAKVYCHITNNKFSKPNTMAEFVIDEAEEYFRKLYSEPVEALAKENKDLKEALERVENCLNKATNCDCYTCSRTKRCPVCLAREALSALEAIQSAQSMERNKEGEV